MLIARLQQRRLARYCLVSNGVTYMVEKGSLFLKNNAVISLYDSVKLYESTIQDTLYSQYKTAYKISVSNYFRGNAADSFKNYITNGTINIISGFLDISSDMTMIIQLFAAVFTQYEVNSEGCVDEGVLDYINQTLNSKENTFESARNELNTVLQMASKYIEIKELSLDSVNTGYTNVRDTVKKIREDMYEVDDEALKSAEELFFRIQQLKTLIQKTMSFCYNDDGKINYEDLNTIQTQDWFQKSGNITLSLLLQEDPFEYDADESAVAEDQWARGLCSDVYAYAGYSFLTSSWESGTEDGISFSKGKAALLTANGYAQLTDYLNGSVNIDAMYMSGEIKSGNTDEYYGFRMEGNIGAVKADSSIVIGSEEINAYVKGEAEALCADGKVAFEFEDDGEFAVGFKGSATAVDAGVSGGISILGYDETQYDTKTGKKTYEDRLLGFDCKADFGLGVGAAFWAESKTAYETEFVNINATTINIKGKFLLGLELNVTVPTPYFKWPW